MILPVVLPAGLHVNSVPRVMMVTVLLNVKCMTPSATIVALPHKFPSSPAVPNPYTVVNASKTLKTDTNCKIFDFRPIQAEVFIIFVKYPCQLNMQFFVFDGSCHPSTVNGFFIINFTFQLLPGNKIQRNAAGICY